eukprot:1144962-Pelagomonas_calceolata.AAC.7
MQYAVILTCIAQHHTECQGSTVSAERKVLPHPPAMAQSESLRRRPFNWSHTVGCIGAWFSIILGHDPASQRGIVLQGTGKAQLQGKVGRLRHDGVLMEFAHRASHKPMEGVHAIFFVLTCLLGQAREASNAAAFKVYAMYLAYRFLALPGSICSKQLSSP